MKSIFSTAISPKGDPLNIARHINVVVVIVNEVTYVLANDADSDPEFIADDFVQKSDDVHVPIQERDLVKLIARNKNVFIYERK